MKTILVAASLLCASLAVAREIEGNPDRKISVGLEYTGTFLKGDREYPQIAFPKQDIKDDQHAVLADLRLPVNVSLTLIGGVGYVVTKREGWDSDILLFKEEDRLSGPRVKLGARFYFD